VGLGVPRVGGDGAVERLDRFTRPPGGEAGPRQVVLQLGGDGQAERRLAELGDRIRRTAARQREQAAVGRPAHAIQALVVVGRRQRNEQLLGLGELLLGGPALPGLEQLLPVEQPLVEFLLDDAELIRLELAQLLEVLEGLLVLATRRVKREVLPQAGGRVGVRFDHLLQPGRARLRIFFGQPGNESAGQRLGLVGCLRQELLEIVPGRVPATELVPSSGHRGAAPC
jgi:hypothetical protein